MDARVIPTLLLKNESLVKTTKFKQFKYIGDPCNTLRIFNELEVDELLILDITATKEKKDPNYNFRGYIDDLRITKNLARYTSNFTPPAQQLTINV